MTTDATIRLIRQSAWSNLFRKFSVYIDDQKVGTIRNGCIADFSVASGLHQLFVKIDWCCSNIIEVDVYPSSTAQFVCGKSPALGSKAAAALSDIPGEFISIWPPQPEV